MSFHSTLDIKYTNIYSKSASKAGQRYCVFISPEMPNIKLKYINYLNAIILNDSFLYNIKATIKSIEQYNYESHQLELKKVSKFIDPLISSLYNSLKNFSINIDDTTELLKTKNFLNKLLNIVQKRRNTHSNKKYKNKGIDKGQKEQYSYIESKYRDLYNNLYNIKEEFQYFDKSFNLKPYMLIVGEAGIGKTHFILDSTKDLLDLDNNVLVFLGEIFKNDLSILETIKKELKVDLDDNDFLDSINEISKTKNSRFLIVIDAINEMDTSADIIKSKISNFMDSIKKYKHISIVLSCRTPYQHQILSDLDDFFIFELPGLPQQEALRQFSISFDLQPIELPYIVNELSNPLFLKTVYETIKLKQNQGETPQVSTLLNTGNESLKELFEKYIFYLSIDIFKHKKHKLLLWNKVIKPICELNFKSLQIDKRYELTEDDVKSIIDSNISVEIMEFAQIDSSKSLLDKLINIGIFRRDIDYRTSKEVIKVTYQKLYDYLMARYIFDVMPKKSSNTIEEITTSYNKLIVDFNYFSFIEAIIVEFPTRNQQEELFDYLSADILEKNSTNLLRVFIDGLLWRAHTSFTDRTKYYINKSLCLDHESTLEALFVLSTKPKHPFTEKTFSFFEKMSLKERDLILSRFLRYRIDEENPIGLYLEWLYEYNTSKLEPTYVYNLFNYLVWFFTLPINALRDKISYIFVELGTNNLNTLFDFIKNKHNVFNDGYILERIIGALYGAMMKVQRDNNKDEIFKNISIWLYKNYFINFSTYHIIVLDHIKSIIELTLSKGISLDIDQDKVFSFNIDEQKNFWSFPKLSICKNFRKSSSFNIDPMYMDFTNYTIGSIFNDRPNYGHSKEYDKAVLRINNRIYQLGWNKSEYKDVDKEYSSNYVGRIGTHSIERYGKKYSWIAYYEYIGYLISTAKLNPRNYYFDDGIYYRFWDTTLDQSFPNIEKFIENKPFLETLSTEFIKKNIFHDKWVMIYGFVRNKKSSYIEFSFDSSFQNKKVSNNSLGKCYTANFGELFWSENIPDCEEFNICFEYSSGDYNTYYSSKFDIVLITKELAKKLNIHVDLLNNQLVDKDGHKAILNYKFSDEYQLQEFTFLRKDLLKNYMKKNNLKIYFKISEYDITNSQNATDIRLVKNYKDLKRCKKYDTKRIIRKNKSWRR